ncbi:hypothetical protein ACLMJK_003411 [Lecanora helva]
MVNHLSASAVDGIRHTMDETTFDPDRIPGCVAVIVDKSGKTLFQHASGRRGANTTEPMTLDSVFWLASFTKMVAGIAAMQLVEQGKLALDDADLVERHCPELKHVRIVKNISEDGKAETVEKKNRITLRMLLSHTGQSPLEGKYTFFNNILRLHGQPIGIDELDPHESAIFQQPIMFEPGTDWAYGIGIDWAGTLIERTTSTPLNTYFQTHIFAPLNLHQITMFPTPPMKHRLAHMNQKTPHQPIRSRDHPCRRPLYSTPAEHPTIYNSAGAGLFARPAEYAQILATLLNDGVSPTTGARILSQRSIDEMFTNQIPQFPDFGRKGIKAAKPTYTNDIPDLYPLDPQGEPQGWGLTFMMTLGEGSMTGRGRGTAWWAGLPNLFWWCDREKGVAGLLASQILPFNDPEVIGLWVKIEKAVYDGLESGKGEMKESGDKDIPQKAPLDGY